MTGDRRERGANAGVSLLEVLVGLAVMSLIAILTTGALQVFARLAYRSQSVDETVRVALDRHTFRDWVERAVLRQGGNTANGGSFSVLAGSIGFTAVLDDGYFWPGEFVRIELSVRQSNSGRSVVARAEGRAESDQSLAVRELGLSSGEATLKLGYFGRLGAEEASTWHDRWDDDYGLP